MFLYDKSIRLVDSTLALDARNYSEACCISHAHADHIRSHRQIFATPPTIEFMKRRLKNVRATAAHFNEPFDFDGYRITFLPAGHILGSAQILIERDGQRLLYSGDFKLEKGLTAENLQIAPCDVLIMECTYGHPRYRFPPREEIADRLCEWARTILRQGETPIIFTYALGKSQEAMKILADNGFALCAHQAIFDLMKVYEKFGYTFGDATLFNRAAPIENRVLMMPQSARRAQHLATIEKKRTMYLSGWAMDSGAKYRFGVDEALPLSDHADFLGLIEYVRQVNPKKIFSTHGPADFARQLRALGYDAEPLAPTGQMEFF